VYSFPDFIRIQQAAQTILDSFIIVALYDVVMLSTIMLQLFQMFKKNSMFEICNDYENLYYTRTHIR